MAEFDLPVEVYVPSFEISEEFTPALGDAKMGQKFQAIILQLLNRQRSL